MLITLFHHNLVFAGAIGSSHPDKLQRPLGNVVAACLAAQTPPAPAGRILETAQGTSGKGAVHLAQDDGASDVHLHRGKVRVFSSWQETCQVVSQQVKSSQCSRSKIIWSLVERLSGVVSRLIVDV